VNQFESDTQAFVLLVIGVVFAFIGWNLFTFERFILAIPVVSVSITAIHIR
jgi:hypothetical protein